MTTPFWILFVLAALPLVLTVWNLVLYRRPLVKDEPSTSALSILIPARNEEERIGLLLESLAPAGLRADDEVIVYDDHSEDDTLKVLKRYQRHVPNLHIRSGTALPSDWNGKQHACHQLAKSARQPILVFVDADVRFEPDGLHALRGVLDAQGVQLVSGLPRQDTEGFWERLLIPQIFFVLLGYLPLGLARRSKAPSFAAGCGQLFVANAAAYRKVGGHERIRGSRHDGLHLPGVFRRSGYGTDVVDLTRVARCRMYTTGAEVVQGLLKNASEGLGAPSRIVPMSVLLLGGQTLPAVMLVWLPWLPSEFVLAALGIAFMALMPRWLIGWRFFARPQDTLWQPLAIAVLIGIQWLAWSRSLRGLRPTAWKGRV